MESTMRRKDLDKLAASAAIVALGWRKCRVCDTGLFAAKEFMTPHEFACYRAQGYIPPEHSQQFQNTVRWLQQREHLRRIAKQRFQRERDDRLFARQFGRR